MTVPGYNEYFLVAYEINMEWQSLQQMLLWEDSREAEEASFDWGEKAPDVGPGVGTGVIMWELSLQESSDNEVNGNGRE